MKHNTLYINRELSWIKFNRRVLEEAENKKNPLLERLKFLSISGSNLDEFLMVRLAGIKGQVDADVNDLSIDGYYPNEILEKIVFETKKLIKEQHRCWKKLKKHLKNNEVLILKQKDLNKRQLTLLKTYFIDKIYPILTPLSLDPAHPFPFINNLALTIIVNFQDHKKRKITTIIPIPESLERFITITEEKIKLVHISDIVISFLNHIFPNYKILSYGSFRVLRDSDIEFSDEAEDLARSFENQLKLRKFGKTIFLEIEKKTPSNLVDLICKKLGIDEKFVEFIDEMIEVSSLEQLTKIKKKKLLWKKFEPRYPERLKESKNDCFLAIKKKEFIVHHPYESFDVVVQFLRQAANDPDVLVIKQTLYRTVRENSEIALALIEAAESGKSVTAIVELKARFDEETNIKYSKDLEKAGVHIVYTFANMKTHAKLSLVVRKEKTGLKTYVHIGTGNYHPDNAKIYSDLSLFSCDKFICDDVQKVFNMITGYAKIKKFNLLNVSPINLKNSMLELIENEIKNKKKGLNGEIWLKCNSLVDKDIIDKLYYASKNGVKIELIIRGVCCLKPGLPGVSENIKVKSIVGRFLEHSRIYCFASGNSMPSRNNKVFISSADLMPRNFERRYEVMVPILNSTVHKQVIDQIMVTYLNDKKQSWIMDQFGNYNKLNKLNSSDSAHDYFMSNPSLSGRGNAIKKSKPKKLKIK